MAFSALLLSISNFYVKKNLISITFSFTCFSMGRRQRKYCLDNGTRTNPIYWWKPNRHRVHSPCGDSLMLCALFFHFSFFKFPLGLTTKKFIFHSDPFFMLYGETVVHQGLDCCSSEIDFHWIKLKFKIFSTNLSEYFKFLIQNFDDSCWKLINPEFANLQKLDYYQNFFETLT